MYYQRAIQPLSNHHMTTVPKYFANFGAKHKVLVVIPNDETSKMCWDNKRFHCDGHTSSLWALHSFLSWISHHASVLVSFCACTFGTKSPSLRISFTCQPSLVSLVPRHKEGEEKWPGFSRLQWDQPSDQRLCTARKEMCIFTLHADKLHHYIHMNNQWITFS